MPQLSCRDLTLGYDGSIVFTGLSFSVNTGEYLCIVGDNGSGKSTLMKAILGLKLPLKGDIARGDGLLANEIGYMPQQTAIQKDFPASVREVVRSGCLNRCGVRPFYSIHEKMIADFNMERLGIIFLAKKCYKELSGGQQQRVLLARALCATQKIVLLDEPAAGLDPSASLEMYTLIKELNENGTTIVMISHDIAASIKYASHILHIGRQNNYFFGETADYTNNEASKVYFGLRGENT